ncbi:MAG: hypothetical protein P9L99_14200 [Candidatus Lernaella stagnicola]|nr:hypothetical protein [Candidatus Lernaella stagnicola]
MATFDPQFDDLAATKRPINRSTVNESMAATTGAGRKKVLVLLPLEVAGSKTDADLVEGLTADLVLSYFGRVALQMMANPQGRGLFYENPTCDLDAIAVAEADAGTAATYTITFETTAIADGSARVWLGDYYVDFSILDEDTADEIATACAAAITADSYAPFTAAAVEAVVTVTYAFKGAMGNDCTPEVVMPDVSTTATVAAGVTGATDPTIDSTYTDLYKMTDYDLILVPWLATDDDVEHMETVATFMANGEQGRGALHVGCIRDTYSNFITWTAARNRKDFAVLFQLSSLPWLTPPHNRAAYEVGVVSAEQNPSVPFQDELRSRVKLGAAWARPTTYDTTIENVLAHGGSIDDLDGSSGDVKIERLISTKTKLVSGVESDAYESVHIFFVEKFIRQAVLDHLDTIYDSRAKKKMVDGKLGDVKGQIVSVLSLYANPPYEYLSASTLAENLGSIVVQKDPLNRKRIQIGIPNPIIDESLGVDVEFFKINP